MELGVEVDFPFPFPFPFACDTETVGSATPRLVLEFVTSRSSAPVTAIAEAIYLLRTRGMMVRRGIEVSIEMLLALVLREFGERRREEP